jgi:long-chain acyl-CoA synthetase
MIEELIRRHAETSPTKVALIAGETEISYAELWQRAQQAADYFVSSGLQAGECVIVSANKSLGFVYAYLGAHLCGLICLPIDAETNSARLRRIIDVATPSLIIGELQNADDYNVLPFESVNSDKVYEGALPQQDAIADILFTTGTTGLPKGVVLTYRNQQAAADNINTFIDNTEEDVELLALPISHSFGLGRLRCVLAKGATLVLLGSFASMKRFFGEMERRHITGFGMVPAGWAYISKMSGDRLGKYASQLRYIEIGSAAMPTAEKARLMELLPHTRICMHYGLTEASRSTFIDFRKDADYLDSVGRSAPNTEIAVFDDAGHRLPDGEEGELCVKGDHVCSGYWGSAAETYEQDFYDGYFKTGDWGYIAPSGYIYLKSRKKEMINVGGKKVSPIEVEEALNTLDGVDESVCIGVPDAVMGEVVKAFIVGSANPNDDERIKREMASLVENYKVPVYIGHIGSIPKTASGKVQRLLLK